MEQSRNIDELKAKIATDPDFINSKKHKYSLKKFLDQSPRWYNRQYYCTLLVHYS